MGRKKSHKVIERVIERVIGFASLKRSLGHWLRRHCFASLKRSLVIKASINTETVNKNQDDSRKKFGERGIEEGWFGDRGEGECLLKLMEFY